MSTIRNLYSKDRRRKVKSPVTHTIQAWSTAATENPQCLVTISKVLKL